MQQPTTTTEPATTTAETTLTPSTEQLRLDLWLAVNSFFTGAVVMLAATIAYQLVCEAMGAGQ